MPGTSARVHTEDPCPPQRSLVTPTARWPWGGELGSNSLSARDGLWKVPSISSHHPDKYIQCTYCTSYLREGLFPANSLATPCLRVQAKRWKSKKFNILNKSNARALDQRVPGLPLPAPASQKLRELSASQQLCKSKLKGEPLCTNRKISRASKLSLQ